jgi:hypothetical protein
VRGNWKRVVRRSPHISKDKDLVGFVGLGARIFVFSFIIEYSSSRDFGPYVVGFF